MMSLMFIKMTVFLKKIKGFSLKRICLATAVVQAVRERRGFSAIRRKLFAVPAMAQAIREGRGFVFRGRQGFSLIGVMVASIVGLIVVMGMSQMFANMSAQMKGIENQVKRVFFVNFVGSELNDNCDDTLKDNSNYSGNPHPYNPLHSGDSFSGHKIIKGSQTVLDLNAEEDRLEAEYGLSKGSYFQYTCIGATGSGCTCSSTSYTCEKKWKIDLVTRREVNGVWILDKPYSFETIVKFNSSNLPECGNVTLAGGGNPGGASDACVLAEKSTNKQTIVGCPKTAGPTSSVVQGHTAYGYDVGTQGQHNTFIGYTAGTATTGGNNVFLGYETGKSNTSGEHNVFLGRSAGESNTTGGNNIFLGYQAGAANTATNDNTFIGYLAGNKNTTGAGNTFLGYRSGMENQTGGQNTFLGFDAGQNSRGKDNTFIGYNAGTATTTGEKNTFIGSKAGESTTTGHQNLFIGGNAGNKNDAGSWNTFIGYFAGYNNTSGEGNLFFGERAGEKNTTGDYNLFLGLSAGWRNTTGSGNIFIGRGAANTSSYQTVSNRFVVGNPTNREWIVGNIGVGSSSDTFRINGKQVSFDGHTHTPSSRTLKKNIKHFKNFKKSLDDILKTPLFTFEYKKDHPEKSRIGIISEELPRHLQIKEDPILPDWPSIYGTFWASIKALYNKLEDVRKTFSAQLKELKMSLESLRESFAEFQKSAFDSFAGKKELEKIRQELFQTKKELSSAKESLTKTNQELSSVKGSLTKTVQELSQTQSELRELQKQFQSFVQESDKSQ